MKENHLNKVMKQESNNSGSDKSPSYSLTGRFCFYYFTFGSRIGHKCRLGGGSVAPVRERRKERRREGKEEGRKGGKAFRSANIRPLCSKVINPHK